MLFLFESNAVQPHRLAFLASLAPQTKLGSGILLALACLIAPASSPGLLLVVGVTIVQCVGSGIRKAQLRSLAKMYLLGYLPFVAVMLLARQFLPESSYAGGNTGSTAFLWSVVLRGAATMGIAGSSVATMTHSEFGEGLHRLVRAPLLAVLIMQILQQTGLLLAETRRASAAIALRSGSSGKYGMLLLARNIPTVWLPRMLHKAERVAGAMEVRQFGDAPLIERHRRLEQKDRMILIFCIVVLGVSVALHMYRFG